MAITVETGGIPMAMESSRDQEAFSIPISGIRLRVINSGLEPAESGGLAAEFLRTKTVKSTENLRKCRGKSQKM